MNKTIIVMLGIIIIFLIALSILGGINFSEIKEKVNSVNKSLAFAQDSIKETIKNINKIKEDITKAKGTIELAKLDLNRINNDLKQELNKLKDSVKLLEVKRKSIAEKIAKIINKMPGKSKVLKEPQYQKLGVAK